MHCRRPDRQQSIRAERSFFHNHVQYTTDTNGQITKAADKKSVEIGDKY